MEGKQMSEITLTIDNFEAEDLDVDVLQDLMKILVSKGAY